MEKQEKIEKNLQRRFRSLAIVLVTVVCLGVLFSDSPNNNLQHSILRKEQSEEELVELVQTLDDQVRRIKSTGVFMEVDPEGLAASKKLQDATRLLLAKRYGAQEPYRVRIDLEFQDTIPDFKEKGPSGSFVIELAPSSLVPHSIFTFLEVARTMRNSAFHRRAGHVLQARVSTPIKHLAFQEYSPLFPHVKGTVGYAGRPSGPAWYVSIQNNVKNHGPGSQQKNNPYEADSCFGKVIEGFDDVVLDRITKMPGNGFLSDVKKQVLIKSMTILVPRSGVYVVWSPESV